MDAAAAEATVAQQAWRDGFGEVRRLADCFPRREMRLTMREMTEAMRVIQVGVPGL